MSGGTQSVTARLQRNLYLHYGKLNVMNNEVSFTVNFDAPFESVVQKKKNEKESGKQMVEAGRSEIESFRCSLLWRSFGQ